MEDRLKKLEDEMTLVKGRNKRVEADKAWETSKTRIISILLLTYIIASVALYFIKVPDFLLGAIIPTLGFFLSVQSLPFVKRWWVGKFVNKS